MPRNNSVVQIIQAKAGTRRSEISETDAEACAAAARDHWTRILKPKSGGMPAFRNPETFLVVLDIPVNELASCNWKAI